MPKFVLCILLVALYYPNESNAIPCPQGCSCDFTTKNQLEITCGNNAPTPVVLPDSTQFPLQTTVSISIRNSSLVTYPTNLCSYASTLETLDLSSNQINVPVPGDLLSCLTNLKYLYLYNNLIPSIDANAFASNLNLRIVDLNINRLTSIPSTLFPSTLTNLNIINLNNNKVTSLDSWFFFLPSLYTLDLSNNLIRSFTNTVGFSLYNVATAPAYLTMTILIDLTNNQILRFDDSVLALYGVCDVTNLKIFLQLLYPMILTKNPLYCDCTNSYNLLTNIAPLFNQNVFNRTSSLFSSALCAIPPQYSSSSIFSFTTPSLTCPAGVPFSSSTANCGSVITTTTAANVNSNPFLKAPDIPLESKDQPSLYAPQIAGIVLGLLGFLILFLILLYCICPVEILACCFTCIPFFYAVCPCKSGVKRDKEYDLFISYNRSNTKWVKNKLIPFIHERCLVENFILHYNSENKEQEVFGPYIKDIMSRSSCILFVLSDAFLMKEWNNRDFQLHLRYLLTRERTRFICVQLHDVCDEEVDEYFVDKLQIPRFVSLEDDEFMFWTKLGYHLYTNDSEDRILPVLSSTKYYIDDEDKPNDDIDFDRYNINRPIIHLPRQYDPESRNRPAVDERSRGRRVLDTFRTTFMGQSAKNNRANQEYYVAANRQITTTMQQSRRMSKVDVNPYERNRNLESDNEKEYGITNVTYQPDEPVPVSGVSRIDTKALSAKRNRNLYTDGYSIKKTDGNLQITMPVAHDVYMSHQVQNKIVRTSSTGYYNNNTQQNNWNDSNESTI